MFIIISPNAERENIIVKKRTFKWQKYIGLNWKKKYQRLVKDCPDIKNARWNLEEQLLKTKELHLLDDQIPTEGPQAMQHLWQSGAIHWLEHYKHKNHFQQLCDFSSLNLDI